ncbi:hypothetical protein BS50DRAFT_323945 [Corynespora cassiicola Philippines]|uniref:Uncharacterized protein n=1 Tax=Corynespora cassiicola Philippines TaxID=1448308 RepID=A0A2T2NTI8_CORCC|nr:hypothetical protein BS50DRAFT_323945 [Corynespora cassiicola Philippines]
MEHHSTDGTTAHFGHVILGYTSAGEITGSTLWDMVQFHSHYSTTSGSYYNIGEISLITGSFTTVTSSKAVDWFTECSSAILRGRWTSSNCATHSIGHCEEYIWLTSEGATDGLTSASCVGGYGIVYDTTKYIYRTQYQRTSSAHSHTPTADATASESSPSPGQSLGNLPTATSSDISLSGSSSNNVNVIVGSVVGGVVALALIGAVVFFLIRRNRLRTPITPDQMNHMSYYMPEKPSGSYSTERTPQARPTYLERVEI